MPGFWSKKPEQAEVYANVVEGLAKLYRQKLFPLEECYNFEKFHSPYLTAADFTASPMVLLIGQYSTGKTTFIRYLLEQDFPGIRIGPEPTTDKFIIVMHDEQERVIPGNALVVDREMQFRPLEKFGNGFLTRLQCSKVNNPVLRNLTIVDTPGILSGEKQRTERGYSFRDVIHWFAERVDRIILLFDAHKLDISDEFRDVIMSLGGYEEKIRICLNKADRIDSQQLMRVYGALMWSLGKILGTPEVARVYIGSYWNEPLHYDTNQRLFELEEQDLFNDLQTLPKDTTTRKLNDLIKRARLAKVHAYIISYLRKEMPAAFGKDSKKAQLIRELPKIYEIIARDHNISVGDFPDIGHMQEILQQMDFKKFSAMRERLVKNTEEFLAVDIPRLMAMIPQEQASSPDQQRHIVSGGRFTETNDNPFGVNAGVGIDEGRFEEEWVVSKEKYKWDEIFESLHPVDGKVNGANAKQEMVKSKLPFNVLGKVWKLADVDQDGMLDSDEFALAMHLINVRREGHEIPTVLPDHLIPPSKRQ